MRGTGEDEKQLKNARTEFSEEHEEIAPYLAIETLATEIGDTETAKLAKGIRREEERMASFLEKQIPILTKAVAKAEIPRRGAEREAGVATEDDHAEDDHAEDDGAEDDRRQQPEEGRLALERRDRNPDDVEPAGQSAEGELPDLIRADAEGSDVGALPSDPGAQRLGHRRQELAEHLADVVADSRARCEPSRGGTRRRSRCALVSSWWIFE